MRVESLGDFLEAAALYGVPARDEWDRWCHSLFPERRGGVIDPAALALVRAITEDAAVGTLGWEDYYREHHSIPAESWPHWCRTSLGVRFQIIRGRVRRALVWWLAVEHHYPLRAAMSAVGYRNPSAKTRGQVKASAFCHPPARIQRALLA